jgi:hypothetical protein
MTLLAGSSDIDIAPTTLAHPSHRTAEREREPPNQAWAPPDVSCLRCGGLLVPSFTSPFEGDIPGKPMTLWRCVNCGDCVDRDILANRRKGPGTARVRARPPIGPQYSGLLR